MGTKFAPPTSILFMVELEGKNKPYLLWRYIGDIYFF